MIVGIDERPLLERVVNKFADKRKWYNMSRVAHKLGFPILGNEKVISDIIEAVRATGRPRF